MVTAGDLTTNGMTSLQGLANKLAKTNYEIIKLGDYKFIRGMTYDMFGRQVAIVGVVVALTDVGLNGLQWKNGTDLAIAGAAFIPGVGWAICTVYYLADPIVKQTTGKNIGDHLGDFAEGAVDLYNDLQYNLNSWQNQLRYMGR